MEFLKRLFGQDRPRTPLHAEQTAASSFNEAGRGEEIPSIGRRIRLNRFGGGRIVEIVELGAIGQSATSPNGRFTLFWRDGDAAGRVGGHRYAGHGRVLLIDGDAIVADVIAERPNEGRVADNGSFIINDWLFGDELSGRFRAYRSDGSIILDRLFAANLYNNGLADDGRLALCQTANAPGSADDNVIAFFDLEAGIECACFHPDMGWASHYRFHSAERRIELLYDGGDIASYHADGAMIDRDRWTARRIAAGDLTIIRAALGDSSAPLDGDLAARLADGLRAKASGDAVAWERAQALRLLGELSERLGQPEPAIEAYEGALRLDPQIGVSRRLDKLLKEAGRGPAKGPRKSRFDRHCQRLGISHELIELERAGPKEWRHGAGSAWSRVEDAALDHYCGDGWNGAASEGGLILTLIKAASFETLPKRSADTFIEALYAQNVAFEEDRHQASAMIEAIKRASLAQLRRNWSFIAATAGDTPAFYPQVRWPDVEGLFAHLGNERLADIARIFAAAPYDLRAGWPDLTLWRAHEIRFVEVKAPGDQLHASQSQLISQLLVPLGFPVTIAEVVPRPVAA